MKVIIMCGGKGTRLREETAVKPKPMVEIGGRPILWHIMSIYARFGFKDFILPLGYKGEVIKQYFHDYTLRNTDFSVDLATGDIVSYPTSTVDWRVTLCDTGAETLKGARIKRVAHYLEDDEQFMVTYGDGVLLRILSCQPPLRSRDGKAAEFPPKRSSFTPRSA